MEKGKALTAASLAGMPLDGVAAGSGAASSAAPAMTHVDAAGVDAAAAAGGGTSDATASARALNAGAALYSVPITPVVPAVVAAPTAGEMDAKVQQFVRSNRSAVNASKFAEIVALAQAGIADAAVCASFCKAVSGVTYKGSNPANRVVCCTSEVVRLLTDALSTRHAGSAAVAAAACLAVMYLIDGNDGNRAAFVEAGCVPAIKAAATTHDVAEVSRSAKYALQLFGEVV